MNSCYSSSIQEFLKISRSDWLETMKSNYLKIVGDDLSDQQIMAWEDCYDKSLPFFEACSDYNCGIVFEYYMPREGGRRPDVILLSGNKLIILEYKMKKGFKSGDLDQLRAYSRDLKHYHAASHDLEVVEVLVPTMVNGKCREYNGTFACTTDELKDLITPHLSVNKGVDLDEWLNSKYEPLPSLISAAKEIYNSKDLPSIKKANSSGIPEAVEALINTVHEAKSNNRRVLALVTGVPGAGKTLLGLDFVHKVHNNTDQKAVFLSGNGPLVRVLQDALSNDRQEGKSFVNSLHNFIDGHLRNNSANINEHIIVFDEAQRAWDKEQIKSKHRSVSKSEPELLIEIANDIPNWSLVLGLIGEGQEIHVGEEAGIIQWADAVKKLDENKEKWLIVSPPKLKDIFENAGELVLNENLDLNISLRSHLADDVSAWVSKLLEGKVEEAAQISEGIHQEGFNMYISRNLEKIKRYCKIRYSEEIDKKYGLICSSKAKNLKDRGVDNCYNTTINTDVAKWYNSESDSSDSCCNLDKVVTEFACQGLELDMPVVCWGDDFRWENENWASHNINKRLKDPHNIKLNVYRVLLTRGRDGFIIFVPEDKNLDDTFELLKRAGVEELKY